MLEGVGRALLVNANGTCEGCSRSVVSSCCLSGGRAGLAGSPSRAVTGEHASGLSCSLMSQRQHARRPPGPVGHLKRRTSVRSEGVPKAFYGGRKCCSREGRSEHIEIGNARMRLRQSELSSTVTKRDDEGGTAAVRAVIRTPLERLRNACSGNWRRWSSQNTFARTAATAVSWDQPPSGAV